MFNAHIDHSAHDRDRGRTGVRVGDSLVCEDCRA